MLKQHSESLYLMYFLMLFQHIQGLTQEDLLTLEGIFNHHIETCTSSIAGGAVGASHEGGSSSHSSGEFKCLCGELAEK